jgi:hypothetical protein
VTSDTRHAMHMQSPKLRNIYGCPADVLVLCRKHARLLIGQWISHATKLFKLLAWRIIMLYIHMAMLDDWSRRSAGYVTSSHRSRMTFSGLIEIVDKRTYIASHEHPS